MRLPLLNRFKTVPTLLLALLPFLSACDSTSTTASSSQQGSSGIIYGHWSCDPIRMPDSTAWRRGTETGTFTLSHDSSSFSVIDTLSSPLGEDTLGFDAWTLSLKTTTARCKADQNGKLSFLATPVRDSSAIQLLLLLDSLQSANPSTWGSSKDSRIKQVASLIKAYAWALLAQRSVASLPSRPNGLDSLAALTAVLELAVQQNVTSAKAASLLSLPSNSLDSLVRALYAAGTLSAADTLVLHPSTHVANLAPSFKGAGSLTRSLGSSANALYAGWITAISAGNGETSQKVHFEVVTDSGASAFDSLPRVDSIGTLRFTAKSTGIGYFRIRARDDGGHAYAGDVDSSSWSSFSISLVKRPVLSVSGLPDTLAMTEDSWHTREVCGSAYFPRRFVQS